MSINPYNSGYGYSSGVPVAPINSLPTNYGHDKPNSIYLEPFHDSYHRPEDEHRLLPPMSPHDRRLFDVFKPLLIGVGLMASLATLGLLLPSHRGQQTASLWSRLFKGGGGNSAAQHDWLESSLSKDGLKTLVRTLQSEGSSGRFVNVLNQHEALLQQRGASFFRRDLLNRRSASRNELNELQQVLQQHGATTNDKKAQALGFADALEARLYQVKNLLAISESHLADASEVGLSASKRLASGKAAGASQNKGMGLLNDLLHTEKLAAKVAGNADYAFKLQQLQVQAQLAQGAQQVATNVANVAINQPKAALQALQREAHWPAVEQQLTPTRRDWLREINARPF